MAKVIKIHDCCFSHEPNFLKDTPNFKFIRSLKQFERVEIQKDDIVIYTDCCLTEISPLAKINIALLIEGQDIHRNYYNYIANNNHLFDYILTFDKKLLDRGENFKLNLYGTTWINEIYRKIWQKSKICSFILSNKDDTYGHRFRHDIAKVVKDVDLYGSIYTQLNKSKTRNFDSDHDPKDLSNQKILGIKDYMFSIVMENTKEDYYFTEKLIDCLLTGTVPIYYGCPSIGNFFNIKGILTFTTLEECVEITKTLSQSKYDSMMPYIKENYEKAQNFADFKIDLSFLL
jgi:hypothetical protein